MTTSVASLQFFFVVLLGGNWPISFGLHPKIIALVSGLLHHFLAVSQDKMRRSLDFSGNLLIVETSFSGPSQAASSSHLSSF